MSAIFFLNYYITQARLFMFKRNIDRIMSHFCEPLLKGRIVIIFLLLITSCGPSNNSKSNEDKPIVVTSFFPLYDFAAPAGR